MAGSNHSKSRLVYFGSGEFGLPTLLELHRQHSLALIITQPDRPAGRHRQLTPTPVGRFAAQHGLPCLKPESVNEPEIHAAIEAAQPEVNIVIAYGQKLGPALLHPQPIINLHASLLPKLRGAAPINRAMMQGESTTGVSVITVVERMDAGDILAQRSTEIDPMETAGDLHDRLAELGPEVVLDVIEQLRASRARPVPQDQALVTFAPKLSKQEGTVRFDQPTRLVQARVHGLTPWPGCTVLLEGRAVKLLRVDVVSTHGRHGPPGLLLDDLTVACAAGAVRLLSVQPPGGRMMTFESYCNGHEVEPGDMFMPLAGIKA